MKANHRLVVADFVWELDDTVTVEQAFEKLSAVVSTLGFDGVAYTLMPRTLGVPFRYAPVFLNSNDFSQGFLEHYQQANLAQSDFTIRRISEGWDSVLDWQKEAQTDLLTSKEQDLVTIAQHDYGITNALTLPVDRDSDLLAGFSVTSSLSRPLFADLVESNQAILVRLCHHFHHLVIRRLENRSMFYSPVLDALNRDERCLIDLVSNGNRLKQSQDLYGISPTSAGNILHRLYKKFSVSDKGQLGCLIGRHQLVELLEIHDK